MLLDEFESAMKMERKDEDEEEVRNFIESRSYKYIDKNGQLKNLSFLFIFFNNPFSNINELDRFGIF